MRTEGSPALVAVARAAASGSSKPASRASATHAASVARGSGSRLSSQTSTTRIYCRRPRIRWVEMAATRTIEIRTEIPGPRSRELAEREARVVAHPLLVHLPIFAERAENATITDVDGNVFVDFAGGVGVVNAGHGHPRVIDAVVEQAQRFLHTDFTVVPYETYITLAERLCALVPIGGDTRAAFFNAGTEAVE